MKTAINNFCSLHLKKKVLLETLRQFIDQFEFTPLSLVQLLILPEVAWVLSFLVKVFKIGKLCLTVSNDYEKLWIISVTFMKIIKSFMSENSC